MEKAHCGYTNYQTWCIAIAIHNNREALAYWEHQAADCVRQAEPDEYLSPTEVAASTLAKHLQGEFEQNLEVIQVSVKNQVRENLYLWRETQTRSYHGMDWVQALVDLTTSYVNESLSQVNWFEIAKELIESVQE